MDNNSASAQPVSYTSQLTTLRNRIADPDASGYDLVWLAMICLYLTTEQQLRDSVEEMSDKLAKIEEYRKFQRFFKEQAEAGQSSTLSTIGSAGNEDFKAFKETPITGGAVEEGGTAKSIGVEIDLGDGNVLKIYWADDLSTEGFNELTGEVSALNWEGEEATASFGEGATFRAVLEKDGVATMEFLSFTDDDGNVVTHAYSLKDVTETDDIKNKDFYDGRLGFAGKNPNSTEDPDRFFTPEGIVYQRTIINNDSIGFGASITLDNGVTLEFDVPQGGGVQGIGFTQSGESVGRDVSWDGQLSEKTYNDGSKERDSAEIDQDHESVLGFVFDENSGKLVLNEIIDSETDQATSYDSQVLDSESALEELGIVDENGDGSRSDDVLTLLNDKFGYDFKAGHIFTTSDFDSFSTNFEDEISSLNSLNQIDMLYLEKIFNVLNTLITSLSGIESSHNRTLTNIAQAMG